jgi:hypothetical protein
MKSIQLILFSASDTQNWIRVSISELVSPMPRFLMAPLNSIFVKLLLPSTSFSLNTSSRLLGEVFMNLRSLEWMSDRFGSIACIFVLGRVPRLAVLAFGQILDRKFLFTVLMEFLGGKSYAGVSFKLPLNSLRLNIRKNLILLIPAVYPLFSYNF